MLGRRARLPYNPRMRLTRIYHPEALQPGQEVELPTQAANHITRVMRLKVGAELTLFNGDGFDYAARLSAIQRNRAWVQILSKQAVNLESPLAITLIQGISRGDRMDYTIQKAVELGIRNIVPVYTERSMARMDSDRMVKKLTHWQGVVSSACEQCGRARLPELGPPVDLRNWLDGHDSNALRLILDPTADNKLGTLQAADRITLLVGPEGGLSEDEIRMVISQGFTGIRLGPRILRTETAAVATLGAIQALWGDFR